MSNPEYDIYNMEVNELNNLTINYLEKQFLNHFIDIAKIGMENAHKKSIEQKRKFLS